MEGLLAERPNYFGHFVRSGHARVVDVDEHRVISTLEVRPIAASERDDERLPGFRGGF
jgi:hypothetical protein